MTISCRSQACAVSLNSKPCMSSIVAGSCFEIEGLDNVRDEVILTLDACCVITMSGHDASSYSTALMIKHNMCDDKPEVNTQFKQSHLRRYKINVND